MDILWWLAPAVGATLLAMAYVAVVGREQPPASARTEADVARLAAALQRPLPASRRRPRPTPERSTGVAMRPTGRPTH